MNSQEALNILRAIKDVSFATVDNEGNPQNRIIDVMGVENETLYFLTARGKDFYRELTESGKVAISGMNEKYQAVRFSGKVEKLENREEWINKMFEDNPSMEEIYPGNSRQILDAFCISKGKLEFFDLSKNPLHREYFAVGGEIPKKTGFLIHDDCIECGICKKKCPEQCISEGTPYIINQPGCLHCGLCFEKCPVDAIRRI